MLSIVIITKDTEELLKNLLFSINKDETIKPFLKEVIVVDNGSIDKTSEMIQGNFPDLMYIKNEKNEGFAAAVNKALFHAVGKYIYFLNSDTLIIEGEIKKMLDIMENNPDIGICGPQLVYPDMRLQRSFAYVPSLLFEIFPRSLAEIIYPEKISSSPSGKETNVIDVPSLIGAAILTRKNVLDTLKGFDERFFFFLEETDLCLRVKNLKYGNNGKTRTYRVVFYPYAKVIHLQGKTVSKNWVSGRIEYNISLYKFIKKHHSSKYFMFFKSIRFFKCSIFLILFFALPLLPVKEKLKRSYIYYSKLFLWHIKGCPDNKGLRA